MPTLFIEYGFRFFFYSNEGNEPVHVHIEKAEKSAKFWMTPIEIEENHGFSAGELRLILVILKARKADIENGWSTFFGK